MHRQFRSLSILVGLLPSLAAADRPISFQNDIRPILADRCFLCHGPDDESRGADLRLDSQESAHEYAIVAGKPDQSEFMARILSKDDDTMMPPPESERTLSAVEIDLLRRWIVAGGDYQPHWAFTQPSHVDPPRDLESTWGRNPIDAFVLRRLHDEELVPSPDADRVTWLRRVSLDLIGLPPTIDEVDAFLADSSRQAHQKQIERLLKSPHYGERWGRIWLDAARYADSDGYEKDKPRQMWFYRDWVISALNADMPYDDFIIHQIAGDLLPGATQENLVATGFLRNSMVNEEGGADPEQFRMEGMFDRMDAIGKAILGLTLQCGQCHSHKYDPLTQTDYYRMFAFLNNTHDAIVPVYTEAEQAQRDSLLNQIAAIETELRESLPDWESRMTQWETEARRDVHTWEVLEPAELPFEGQKFRVLDDFSIVSESYAPTNSKPQFVMRSTSTRDITGIRLELLTHPQLPRRGPGRSIRGTAALSEFTVFVAPADQPEQRTKVKIVSTSADVNPEPAAQPDYLKNTRAKDGDKRITGPIQFANDGDAKTAWTTDIDPGRRNQPRKAVFVFEQPVGFEQGTVITVAPTMSHGGWNSDDNHNCLMGRYRFSLTTDANPVADPLPNRVREILQADHKPRTAEQESAIFSYWRTTQSQWTKANAKIESLWKQYPEGTTQLVLEQRDRPRMTSVLRRGDFLNPDAKVDPGVPGFLHSLPDDADSSRLTFAKWLVDPRSPTTARSIVNRIWQAYFGIGLVETSDDLGSQSAPPSHPELLDWLALELMDSGWSLKHLHRLITSSATYRQSSIVAPDLYQRDPYNRLLARGPRFRVDAEIVRDITLAASGLLNRKLGGPSVYPPAPGFLFQPPASYGPKTWNIETGDNRYRRGLYTFRFRSVPYPMLETFDAVPGNVSCVRRNRSNTPLQALTMLNEPLMLESARALARRTIRDGGKGDRARITFAMRQCVSRHPKSDEIDTLGRLLVKQRQRVAAGEIDARQIVDAAESDSQDITEHAAWTLVARVMLNLDETITKE